MNKTLLILSTHFVDEAIISEYKKMRDTPNVDAILAIDNTAFKYDFTERIENKNFYGVSAKCFFFDSKLHDEMDLPYFSNTGGRNSSFGVVMWNNCDYRFYYVKKFFPNYDFYWQFEYDVFCNAKTYEGFLKKFAANRADLLVNNFRNENKNSAWPWVHGLDWAYNKKNLYGSLFSVVRLSARAVDFLYKCRLEYTKIFHDDGGKNKWPGCEAFTPIELMNNGFSCENLNEPNVKFIPHIYLNDDRFFLTPDDKLYHPVKPVKKELDKLNTQINDLNLLSRKIFLTALVKFLDAFNVKGLPYHIAPDFSYLALPIVTLGGGGQPQLYYLAQIFGKNIDLSLKFEGNFSNVNLAEFAGVPSLRGFKAVKSENRLSIFTTLPDKIEDAAEVATIMKNFITGTYPVIKKNFLEENK